MTDKDGAGIGLAKPSISRREIVVLGAGIVGLSVCRAFPDLLGIRASVFEVEGWRSLPWRDGRWIDFIETGWAAWPFVLGTALMLTRSRRLVRSAALVAFVMAAERFITLLVGGLLDSGWTVIYRTDIPSGGASLRSPRIVIGVAVSAVSWLALGFFARHLVSREQTRSIARTSSGRHPVTLCWLVSITFAIALLGGLAWTSYIDVVSRVPWVRSLILSGDRVARKRVPRVETPEMKRASEADRLFRQGMQLQGTLEFVESRRELVKSLNRFESLVKDYPENPQYSADLALVSNNLAWMLSTCQDESIQDAEAAVMLAERATVLAPSDGNSWNTLGAAYYRMKAMEKSESALQRSMNLREGGDAFDWYFLGLVNARRKAPEDARRWYDKAVAWNQANRPRDPELMRFRIELADALDLAPPDFASETVKDKDIESSHAPSPSRDGAGYRKMGRRR